MTDQAFADGILSMRQTLYRVSYGLLRNEQDRLDAVQECLAKAWEKRATLRQVQFFETWVTRILINECHNIQRHRGRVTLWESMPDGAAPQDADPVLHDAILALPQKLRLPVMLYYMEGYNAREVADILHLPQGTISTRLHKARAVLKEAMGDDREEVLHHA